MAAFTLAGQQQVWLCQQRTGTSTNVILCIIECYSMNASCKLTSLYIFHGLIRKVGVLWF